MQEFLARLRKKVTIGVVGGSDFVKINEQLGGSGACWRCYVRMTVVWFCLTWSHSRSDDRV